VQGEYWFLLSGSRWQRDFQREKLSDAARKEATRPESRTFGLILSQSIHVDMWLIGMGQVPDLMKSVERAMREYLKIDPKC
jgi:hypothetical protein